MTCTSDLHINGYADPTMTEDDICETAIPFNYINSDNIRWEIGFRSLVKKSGERFWIVVDGKINVYIFIFNKILDTFLVAR